MVRLRSLPPDSEPSIVTPSVELNPSKPADEPPEMVLAAPLGLIKTVNPPAISLRATVPVSPARSEEMSIVMLLLRPAALIAQIEVAFRPVRE